MGKQIFDFWTFLHFIFGFISTSTILPSKPKISLVIANLSHLVMELVENNKNDKTGEILESTSNHIGDILAFLIGSFLGYFYGCIYFSSNNLKIKITRYILLVLSFGVFLQELLREIFPNDWILDPSYKPINW